MNWMAWTLPTGLFFAAIASALSFLIALELKKPTTLAKGWLPMATTRGDRFFVSLAIAQRLQQLEPPREDQPAPESAGS